MPRRAEASCGGRGLHGFGDVADDAQHQCLVLALGHHADQRLGAGLADEEPPPAGELGLALADQTTFLGWTRIMFENGQTGWVRKEDIVPLWK